MELQKENKYLLEYQQFKGMLFHDMVCPEETIYWTLKYILYGCKVSYDDIKVDYVVYSIYTESYYWCIKQLFQVGQKKG